MGAKQTKIECEFLPETPSTGCRTSKITNMDCNTCIDLDPRSPLGCRTPIILQTKPDESTVQLSCTEISKQDHCSEKASDVLRKRFFKSFTYNLNDPRSPSQNLNRTPLVFEDTFEKPLNLDDTFSNLFVESHFSKSLNKVEQPGEASQKQNFIGDGSDKDEKEKMTTDLEEKTEQQTPIAVQQEFDPRSPSIGVERTPIIFSDDVDETSEDIMLENILTTLSLDMKSSGDISLLSSKSLTEDICSTKTNKQEVPLNKHLDRVRTGKKSLLKSKHKPKRSILNRKIYEDQENHLPLTPIFKTRQSDKNYPKDKRTPLSCVRNRNDTHVRSRSVESSAKSIKARLALTSFDDTFNPSLKSSIRITRQASRDSIDFN